MLELRVEPRLRRVVADNLGVALEDLTPEVSLTDDLAADSLDLLELALALEEELGFTVPERVLSDVRTYGDLVPRDGDARTRAARRRGARQRGARLLPGPGHSCGRPWHARALGRAHALCARGNRGERSTRGQRVARSGTSGR